MRKLKCHRLIRPHPFVKRNGHRAGFKINEVIRIPPSAHRLAHHPIGQPIATPVFMKSLLCKLNSTPAETIGVRAQLIFGSGSELGEMELIMI
jgi:hypothetical protein